MAHNGSARCIEHCCCDREIPLTAINFAIGRSQIFIASDSLVNNAFDKTPVGFTSKVVAIPHMRMATGGIGDYQTCVAWISALLLSCKCADVEEANEMAPACLANVRKKAHGVRYAPTVVFTFGIDRDDKPAVFRYDSDRGFEPERLAPDIYINPSPVLQMAPALELLARERTKRVSGLEHWANQVKTCAGILRLQQWEWPEGVGGRVQCTMVTVDGIHQTWLQELPRAPPPLAD